MKAGRAGGAPERRLFAALAAVLLLLALEGVVRVVLRHEAAEGLPRVDDDLSWRRSWVARHGPDIAAYYGFDRYDPTKGWATKAGLEGITVFGDKTLTTDARGFRVHPFTVPAGAAPAARVAVLGDSFTFGDEVGDGETYSARLQELLPAAEVVNMGVHGYGHDQMLILWEELGPTIEPDVVVVGFVYMDLSRNLRSFRDYAKPRFEARGNDLVLTNYPVPPPEAVLRWDWARPRLVDLASMLGQRVLELSGAYEREGRAVSRRILSRLDASIREAGAVPVFVFLPVQEEILGTAEPPPGERYLMDLCDAGELLACVSARPRFLELREQGVTFKRWGHWGPAGHQAVAEVIAGYLVGEGLVEGPVAR